MLKKDQDHLLNEVLNEPIAIIGMNCRFPGVNIDIEDINALNEMLVNGLTPIRETPKERWDVDDYYDADRAKEDKIVSRKGGFLSTVHLFDAAFFKISSVEAKQMDPQHRLFLEVAVRALNHANLPLESLRGSNTGVYCGLSTHEYSQLNYKDNIRFNAYTAIGSAPSAAAGRLAHFLDLKGPCLSVDTACSSSLSALYLAATALRTRQCDLAIVGGVHLNLCPESFIGLSKAKMLSARGQCSSFDVSADGYVRSEGCGVIIVQRLPDAIKNNNTIHAVLRSITMNQDGDGSGLLVPNLDAQIAVHQTALNEAQITAAEIDYIEAHGTGTILGDAIEFNAIKQVHQGHHTKDTPLIIGALKSALGHTISSSGIASLLKVIGAFKQQLIPPNLHYSTPNKSIEPEAIPALLPTQAIPYPRTKNKKRYAQIANYSFSGTNVCAVIEEGDEEAHVDLKSDDLVVKCFVVSAHSESSLIHLLSQYSTYLKNTTSRLEDICFTLINCRDHYRFRCAILAQDKLQLIRIIEAGDFTIRKVNVATEPQKINNQAQLIHKEYLAGALIQLAEEHSQLFKVDLPLYCFDRKDYWHEPRYQQPKNQLKDYPKTEQITVIKEQLHDILSSLMQQESIDEHADLQSLGVNEQLRQKLEQKIQQYFSVPIPSPLPDYLSLDQLTQYIHQLLLPEAVQRQPVVNILDNEPIAIIGMSCRYPKANSIDEFLALLQNGMSGMTDIPPDRWDNEQYYDKNVEALGKLYIRQLGLLNNIKTFDADFFNISPREAKLMAPQLRIFLESSYHALENANLALDKIKDSNTGVFVGVGTNEYTNLLYAQGISLEELNVYFATGNVLNAIAGRVAYSFDFHGPIQAIDTACSSSMTAIHNACLSLQAGDCDLALAGGVNVLLMPNSNITLSKARMLSPDSRCKTFSDDADGYARSEGCGIIVLKRLSSALKDNDTILAVIKGSAINSDGKSGGFTVPNGTAQEEVIRQALAKAQLSPADVDYIEAHGTGTPLADPIEANTLMTIFADSHSTDHPLYLSSVKTNIGHTESASGVAGVIKAVLSLREKKLFKHLNFKALNPGIELKNTVIPLDTLSWDKPQGLRTIGVSSFGFSGANGHLIIQEMPPSVRAARTLPEHSVLVLSAKSKEALELLLQSYEGFLAKTCDEFADICYTAATCRTHYLFRVALIAPSAAAAAVLIREQKYTIYTIKKEQDIQQQYHSLKEIEGAYQQGFKIDWSAFYRALGCSFTKVQLPLYEFVTKEYWYQEKEQIKDNVLPKNWGFQLKWQTQAYESNNSKHLSKNWLLIGATHLQQPLTQKGLTIFLEKDPYQFEQLGGILFALGIDGQCLTNLDDLLEFQKNTIKTLLHWLKELSRHNVSLQLIVLTSQGIAELVNGKVNHCDASLFGFCKTLVLELPQYQTLLIDIDKMDDDECISHILNEIKYNHGASYEHAVAYRDNKRYVSRLRPLLLNKAKRSLSGKGRYLITGGTGGLGLVTAHALLSAGAQELILVARTVHKEEFKKAIKNLDASYPGRLIRVISLDITDKIQLATLLKELNKDGLLKGIIHTAGAAIKAPLTEHQDDDVDYLFAAKVKGAWYLHELTKSYQLDFFVLYSSIAAVFGSNKEAIYSGANSCLDLLIAERHRLGLMGTSIQWGPWGEVGMAQKRSRDHNLKETLINNAQGHHFIKVILSMSVSEATIISPEYLQFMLDFVPRPLPLFYKQLEHDLIHQDVTSQPNLSVWLNAYRTLSADQQFSACKEMVTTLCKEILDISGLDLLDDDEGFFELGFDSLMVAELASKLKKILEPAIKVMVNIAFNYPSINKLAHYIEAELNTTIPQPNATVIEQSSLDDIAVIGMSCSFPQAPNIVAFERLLEEGKNAIQEIPQSRWDNSLYYDADVNAPGKSYVTKLGLVDHIKGFDASFFGITPREAQFMDPQQRLFLECCYTAIENANYPVGTLKGSLTGVFAGVGPNEYFTHLEQSGFSNEELSMYSITGNILNLIAGRIAYSFDFKGPSLSIDTACSSSLVAIHYACQSLKSGEVDYALAGGVNVLLLPESNITLSKARALSPEGQCKTFDKEANGYARAEGCGVLLLKRLSDALRDKDTILAIIKASAVNNDGKSVGLTVPNGTSQAEVMLKALKQARVTSADISYVEAHGTGTPLGDPIEVHAINEVYGIAHGPNNPLYIGTVKTNIGHLESASGVAGVIKTIISLKNKTIYKHLNFSQLNPHIQLNETRIALQNTQWHSHKPLRMAGVSAFGFSGTNAHVIVEEYAQPISQRLKQQPETHLLILSAKSKVALDHLVNQYQEYLTYTDDEFADIAYTAATCRTHYPYRLVVAATSKEEASQYLSNGDFALSYGEDNTRNVTNPNLHTLMLAYLQGKDVDWFGFYNSLNQDLIKVSLPTYTFNRIEFWPDKHHQQLTTKPIRPLNALSKGNTLFMTLKKQTQEVRVQTIQQALIIICADVMKLDAGQLTIQTDLFGLGLDSLMAVEIRSRIHDQLNCPSLSISMEYFINNPRIETMAIAVVNGLTPILDDEVSAPTPLAPAINNSALCDFQYTFWVLHKYNYTFNIGMQFHLKGSLNRDYVEQAFAVVVNQHDAFWIDFNKEIPVQRIVREHDFQVAYEDRSLNEEEGSLDNQFFTNLHAMISLNQQPLIRVFLYKISNLVHEVHIIIPHIIVEGRSCDLILNQFKHNYERLCAGKPLLELVNENNYFHYIHNNNYHYANDLKEKIKFWQEYNRDAHYLYLGAANHLADATIPQDQYLFNYPLPADSMQQFIAWHKAKNRNISSGLIALCHIVFYFIAGQNKVPITLIHTGREGAQYHSSIGLFAEYKRINSIINEHNRYADAIDFIEEQLLKTAPYQKCSYLIKEKNISGMRLTLGQWLTVKWVTLKNTKKFQQSGLDKIIIKLYLRYLGKFIYNRFIQLTKIYLNRWFDWSIPLQKPYPLHVLISITPGFFAQSSEEMQIDNLECYFPNHFAYADRPIGNRNLWVYFSKDQKGIYQLSINGPLTKECKDEMAAQFIKIMNKILINDSLRIADLDSE